VFAWSHAAVVPQLPAGTIHVWAVPLAVAPQRLGQASELLDTEEQQRAARFVHVPSQRTFIIARGTLRTLLGNYLGLSPTVVRFITGPQGKPELAPSCGQDLHFNVSHSGDLALIAVTRFGPIGVDIEHVRPYDSHLDMADRFFSPGEAAALRALSPERREEAFFHIWTRKEAFLKATGFGLSHGLERFEVSVPPDEPTRILHIDGNRDTAARWSLTTLLPAPDYIGTLAVEGQGGRLSCWTWAAE
jgi:4'-phosphopantetheinyl transferase